MYHLEHNILIFCYLIINTVFMKEKITHEYVKRLCTENNITTVKGLREASLKAYKYACKNNLYEWLGIRKDTRGGGIDGRPITFEEVASYCASYGIETTGQLHVLNKKYYNWVLNNKMDSLLGLEKRVRLGKGFTVPTERVWHDINKVWKYLVKWSVVESTTIKYQAYVNGYELEYDKWVDEFGDPDKDISLLAKYLPEGFQEVRLV